MFKLTILWPSFGLGGYPRFGGWDELQSVVSPKSRISLREEGRERRVSEFCKRCQLVDWLHQLLAANISQLIYTLIFGRRKGNLDDDVQWLPSYNLPAGMVSLHIGSWDILSISPGKTRFPWMICLEISDSLSPRPTDEVVQTD